jgi:hypothetical protein
MVVSALVKLFLDPVSIFAELIGITYKLICLKVIKPYATELQLAEAESDSVFHP